MKSRKVILHKENYRESLQYDFPAGIVVFLVALPLCLGISLASDAPMIAGLIAGIIGGVLVPIFSGAQLSISGPAAGLTTVVMLGIKTLGSYEALLAAIILAGILQVILGFLRIGSFAYFFPSSVIKGMLTAIGIILIMKQIPHAVGYDVDFFGDDDYAEQNAYEMALLFFASLEHIEWGALIISSISLVILVFWERNKTLKKLKWVPSALVVVVLSVLMNYFIYGMYFPTLKLGQEHLVNIPIVNSLLELEESLIFPDWSAFIRKEVWIIALTIGVIASLESLLTNEAIDKLDPFKRKSPLNRELKAQGIGNILSGLIGGLPITSVVVRSSAGINAGAKTKLSSMIHGVFLLVSVVFLGQFFQLIPLASLASILLIVGYKLSKPSFIKDLYQKGIDQFAPFAATIIFTLIFNLLIGVLIGFFVGVFFIIRTNFHSPITFTQIDNNYLIKFNKDISFFNKALLSDMLASIEENSNLVVNGKNAQFIDADVMELFDEFEDEARLKNINVTYENMNRRIYGKLSLQVFSQK
jgi:MFS superfamily sulfate permease-like transporter